MYKYAAKLLLPKVFSLLMTLVVAVIGGIAAYSYKAMAGETENHKIDINVVVSSDTLRFSVDPLLVNLAHNDTLTLQYPELPHPPPFALNKGRSGSLFPLEPMPLAHIPVIDEKEVTCLAQAIYSETDRAHEQLATAWSIRNRVSVDKYPDTYCEVVFQRRQYSGLNKGDPNYETNMTIPHIVDDWAKLDVNDYRAKAATRYRRAEKIAEGVILADDVMDPCPGATHFWSPIAYNQGIIKWPSWARGVTADCVIRDRGTKTLRFAFYKNIL